MRSGKSKNAAVLLKVLLAIVVMVGMWSWIFWWALNLRYSFPPALRSNVPDATGSTPDDSPTVAAPVPPFKLLVTVQQEAIEVANETDATWDECHVEIAGGYRAELAVLPPKNTGLVVFDDFKRDGRTVPSGEGYARGKQRVEIACIGPDSQRYAATFGGP